MLNRRDALVLIGAVPATMAMGVGSLAFADDCMKAQAAFAPDRELNLAISDECRVQRWSYKGESYVEERETIVLNEGERIRLRIVNDTSAPQALAFDCHRVCLSTGESFTLDLRIDEVRPMRLQTGRSDTPHLIRVRPSYQMHPGC